MADRLAGVAADEVQRAMMGTAQLVVLELLVGFEREVAIGIEHELEALPKLFFPEKEGVDRRFYVSHVDISGSDCYKIEATKVI